LLKEVLENEEISSIVTNVVSVLLFIYAKLIQSSWLINHQAQLISAGAGVITESFASTEESESECG
jgi:hypothetical protein